MAAVFAVFAARWRRFELTISRSEGAEVREKQYSSFVSLYSSSIPCICIRQYAVIILLARSLRSVNHYEVTR